MIRAGRSLDLTPLKPNSRRRVTELDSNSQLYASCGTILRLSQDPSLEVLPQLPAAGGKLGITHDVLTGQRLNYPPYRTFRCSADKTVVVGTSDPDGEVLKGGYPPEREIAHAPPRTNGIDYDVSPNGRYLAYRSGTDLCVERAGSKLGCTLDTIDGPGKVSVSDSGDVLVGTPLDEPCYFDAAGHVSLEALPSYTSRRLCYAVVQWVPGTKGPVVVNLDGGDPQWISPQTAAVLLAWKVSRQAHTQTKRIRPYLEAPRN